MSDDRESVDHPTHYGGDVAYEVIKVIEAWQLGFHLGNAVKYIARAGKKGSTTRKEDLEKAKWYINRYISMASDPESLKPDVYIIEKLWQEHNLSQLEAEL